MSNKPVWGAGAWAAEAELAEQEQKEREQAAYKAPGKVEAFPSLGDSLSTKPTKKKNKGQTFSLSELTVGKYVGPGGKSHKSYTESQKLTTEELLFLPTGPREHRDEPEIGGLGGGFKDYGGFRANSDNNSRDDNSSRRGGFGGGFAGDRDDSTRGGGGFGRDRERDRDDGPSRADSEDKWGASKKFVPTPANDSRGGGGGGGGGGGYDDDRRGGSRLSDRDLPSRADEVDNWGSTKKFVPTAPASLAGGDGYNERRLSSGGRYEERRHSLGGGGYEEHGGGGGVISRADEVDNWGKGKKFVPSATPPSRVGGMGGGGGGGGLDSAYKEAGSDADRWARRDPLPRVTEQPRATERPRLNLAKRTVPVEGGVTVPSVAAAAAASETNGEKHLPPVGDLTLTDDQQQQAPVVKPRLRSNPFGAARPREEILAEKGQDYRKIDADLEVHKERYGRPGSRPSSSHSSRQGGGVTSRPQTPGGVSSRPHTPDVGARSRPNPFGEAKPRDVVSIEEKGKDWRRLNVDLERRLAEESANAQAEPEENAAAVKETQEE